MSMHRHRVAAVAGSLLPLLLMLASAHSINQTSLVHCEIPGYVFKPGMRPAGPSVTFLEAQNQPSTAAAHAACTADPSCTMFTTDGWLLGTKVYFTTADVSKPLDLATVTNSLSSGSNQHMELWYEQPYCGVCNDAPGCCDSANQGDPCCGTYLAALSASAGDLAVQLPASPAPAIFAECEPCGLATDTESRCCLDRTTVKAVNAPCTGFDRMPVVVSSVGYTTNICGQYNASATSKKFCSPECTVQVLGATLNGEGGSIGPNSAGKAGEGSAIKLDSRCESHSLEQVQTSGHTSCCELCWQACCKEVTHHKTRMSTFKPKPRRDNTGGFDTDGFGRRIDTSLDFPASGVCPQDAAADAATAQDGCCQQLGYVRDHMSLMHSPCSLECALRCGFEVQKIPKARFPKGLWCFESPMMIGWGGFYPKWVKQAQLVKQPMCSDLAAAASAATGLELRTSSTKQQQCSLC
jgi:hypothetical protein